GASLLGGFSQTQGELIAARAVQGLGGAILSPATLTIIITTFTTPSGRAKALGLWSAVAAGGGAAGAMVGGILTDLVSWRWILFVNVPIGVLAFVGARIIIHELKNVHADKHLDILGAVLITSGLSSVVYGIVQTDRYAWTSWQTVAAIGIGVVLIAAFVLVEQKFAVSPLVPLKLLKSRTLIASNLVMMFMSAAAFAMWFFVSLYLQTVLGFSPLKTGFAFLPQTIAIAVAATISSRLLTSIGPKPFLIIGPIIASIGFVWISGLSPHESYLSIVLIPGVMITFGLGFTFAPVAAAATAGVEPRFAGLASGLVNTSRQVGGALGLAALVTIASDRTASLMSHSSNHSQAFVASALTSGWSRAFFVGGFIAILGTFSALAIPKFKKPTGAH
ncbi:MAG: MFS transporter, partial [Acidimicrobiales bacterium]|nr:MFS transporter [Acidimicrobiales bacterium]